MTYPCSHTFTLQVMMMLDEEEMVKFSVGEAYVDLSQEAGNNPFECVSHRARACAERAREIDTRTHVCEYIHLYFNLYVKVICELHEKEGQTGRQKDRQKDRRHAVSSIPMRYVCVYVSWERLRDRSTDRQTDRQRRYKQKPRVKRRQERPRESEKKSY